MTFDPVLDRMLFVFFQLDGRMAIKFTLRLYTPFALGC